MAKTRQRQKDPKPEEGKVLKLPLQRSSEFLSKDEFVSILEKAGFKLDPEVLRYLRVPHALVRGMNEKFEFFDARSTQPIPSAQEDLPLHCFEKGKQAPSWISSWYLCVTGSEGGAVVVFVDKGRGVFLKEAFSDQGELAQKIFRKMSENTIG